MKGKHISRKTQRRLTKPKRYHLMDFLSLLELRDLWYDSERRYGHSQTVRRFPQVYREGKAAQAEIHVRFPDWNRQPLNFTAILTKAY